MLHVLQHGVATVRMLRSVKLNNRILEVPREAHPTTSTGLAAPFASKRMRIIRLSSASGTEAESDSSKSETETISEPVKIPVHIEREVDRLARQINKARKVDYLPVVFIYSKNGQVVNNVNASNYCYLLVVYSYRWRYHLAKKPKAFSQLTHNCYACPVGTLRQSLTFLSNVSGATCIRNSPSLTT